MFGQEQKEVTVPLAKMNGALHRITGDIRLGNSYYDDLHRSAGAFDFVMANPPFNVNGVDKDKLAGDPRLPFGVPRSDNGNYLWIQLLYSALSDKGRAGFVMANLDRRRNHLGGQGGASLAGTDRADHVGGRRTAALNAQNPAPQPTGWQPGPLPPKLTGGTKELALGRFRKPN